MNKIKEKILDKIEEIQIIDSHEHLGPEKEELKIKRDIFSLFSTYSKFDLKQAGMSEDKIQSVFNNDVELEERWKIFSIFWKDIYHTSYSKSILHSLEKFYGFSDLNESNYKDISIAIEENSRPGIYKRILKDASNIKIALTQCCKTDVDEDKRNPLLIPIMPLWLGCGLMTLPSSTKILPESISWKNFINNLNPWTHCNGEWKYKSVDIGTLVYCV